MFRSGHYFTKTIIITGDVQIGHSWLSAWRTAPGMIPIVSPVGEIMHIIHLNDSSNNPCVIRTVPHGSTIVNFTIVLAGIHACRFHMVSHVSRILTVQLARQSFTQEIFPDQKFKLSNISSSEDMLRSDSSLPLGQIPCGSPARFQHANSSMEVLYHMLGHMLWEYSLI